jgi:hypothetical protein
MRPPFGLAAWPAWPSGAPARLLRRTAWLLALAGALFTLAACGGSGQAGLAGASPGDSGPAAVAVEGLDAARERMAREATWTPGQLQAHFEKHGREGPYATPQDYDASARETVRIGKSFRYVDRTTNARRQGYYDPPTNRFTAVTSDGRRIATHFKPDNGERYVRSLPQSTYR